VVVQRQCEWCCTASLVRTHLSSPGSVCQIPGQIPHRMLVCVVLECCAGNHNAAVTSSATRKVSSQGWDGGRATEGAVAAVVRTEIHAPQTCAETP